MTGFEYAAATLMIANGYLAEGERMVSAVRDRYDGEKRNPWNEIECGSNYARSMASFALLPIYSGFSYDMTKNHVGFRPISPEGGQYLFSVGDTWGSASVAKEKHILSILGDPLTLASYGFGEGREVQAVLSDGREIPFSQNGTKIAFAPTSIEKTLEILFV